MPRGYVHAKHDSRKRNTVVKAGTIIGRLRVDADQRYDQKREQGDILQRSGDNKFFKGWSVVELDETNARAQNTPNNTVQHPMHSAVQTAQNDRHDVHISDALEKECGLRTESRLGRSK